MGEAILARNASGGGGGDSNYFSGSYSHRYSVTGYANSENSAGYSPFEGYATMVCFVFDSTNSELRISEPFEVGDTPVLEFSKGTVNVIDEYVASGNYHHWFYIKPTYQSQFELIVIFQ